jgi:hypothetical protein
MTTRRGFLIGAIAATVGVALPSRAEPDVADATWAPAGGSIGKVVGVTVYDQDGRMRSGWITFPDGGIVLSDGDQFTITMGTDGKWQATR